MCIRQWLTVCVCVCVMRDADASTMALVAAQPSAHSGTVNSVGFSPDGTRIVSASSDSSAKVWGGPRLLALCCRVLVVAAGVRWAAADDAWACVRDAI